MSEIADFTIPKVELLYSDLDVEMRILKLMDSLYEISKDKEFCDAFIPELQKASLEDKLQKEQELIKRSIEFNNVTEDYINKKEKNNLSASEEIEKLSDTYIGNNAPDLNKLENIK